MSRSTSPTARPDPTQTPRALWTDAWHRLKCGAGSARHPFHLGVLATCADGAPDQRTVVLRDADAHAHRLTFHTDRRSPKAAAISANSYVSWLFYDPEARLQLRLACRAELLTSGTYWEQRWEASRPQSRLCYTHSVGPGTSITGPLAYGPPSAPAPDPCEADRTGREHFAVVTTSVLTLDWLNLHHEGHRRLRFHVTPFGFDASWIAP